MVKFEVEIPDKEWKKEILKNKQMKHELAGVDINPEILGDDERLATELFGFIQVGYTQFDIRECMTVKKL